MIIRPVSTADSSALRAVYAQYIDTPITFEYALPGEDEYAVRVRETAEAYPYLAALDGGRIIGYAYAHKQHERQAYQWNAELSIYLDRGYTARGIGRSLYGALIDLLRLQGIRTVYGAVTTPNPGSERLHLSFGFTRVGTLTRTGYKCGAWRDVTWFEKQIAPYDDAPMPPVPFSALSREQVERALSRYSPLPLPEKRA